MKLFEKIRAICVIGGLFGIESYLPEIKKDVERKQGRKLKER